MSLPLSLISARRPEVLIQRMQPVAWYDHADTATLFQDAAGTTPTTLNLPIGLRRDKSGRGNHAVQSSAPARPVLNARRNLLLDSNWPNASTPGWVDSGTTCTDAGAVVADGQTFTAVAVANTTAAWQRVLATPAQRVVNKTPLAITVYCKAGTSGSLRIVLNEGAAESIVAGPLGSLAVTATNVGIPTIAEHANIGDGVWRTKIVLTPSSTDASLTLGIGPHSFSPGQTVILLGAQLEHGPIPTRYQRVTTATDYDAQGFPLKCDFDTVDDALVTTFAAPLGSNCTIARSIPGVGAQILTGQTIGTTFSDTTDSHGLLIFDRALTAPETAAVTRWCAGRAGL